MLPSWVRLTSPINFSVIQQFKIHKTPCSSPNSAGSWDIPQNIPDRDRRLLVQKALLIRTCLCFTLLTAERRECRQGRFGVLTFWPSDRVHRVTDSPCRWMHHPSSFYVGLADKRRTPQYCRRADFTIQARQKENRVGLITAVDSWIDKAWDLSDRNIRLHRTRLGITSLKQTFKKSLVSTQY